jgi:hypothetical protein
MLSACNGNRTDSKIKKINLQVEIRRFDRELFSSDTDTIARSIDRLYKKYQDFFEIFSYHIVSLGLPSERTFPGYLEIFINDPLNRDVYNETQKAFPDLKKEEKVLEDAFKNYIYHFGENEIPEVVAFISRFNNSCFTVSNYVGIGLDMYLGSTSEYYTRLDLPQYLKVNMYRKKIPSDIIYTWASEIFQFNDSVNNALSRIVHQGKLVYFTKALLPDQPEELILGYTRDQMRWLSKNEDMMWLSLVENKLLFSDNQMDIRKLTGPAPFTYFFTNESPGRAGIWIGFQIVKQFTKRNPSMSLKQIMDETDYQKILQVSGYNPR